MYSPLTRTGKRRLNEIDDRIESMNKVINNIHGNERFYFQRKMIGVEVRKQKLIAVSAYAQSETSRILLAEIDVLAAENDLKIEIDSIRSCKKFRSSERSVERREKSRKGGDLEATTLLEALVSQPAPRTGKPLFAADTRVVPILTKNETTQTEKKTPEVTNHQKTSHEDKDFQTNTGFVNFESLGSSTDLGIVIAFNKPEQENVAASPAEAIIDEEQNVQTVPAKALQERSTSHDDIKNLFRIYKKIYASENSAVNQVESPKDSPKTMKPGDSPKTASPGDSPNTARSGDSPKTAIFGDSPITGRCGDPPKTGKPGDSPNCDEYSNCSSKSQLTENSTKTISHSSDFNCSNKYQLTEHLTKNISSSSDGDSNYSKTLQNSQKTISNNCLDISNKSKNSHHRIKPSKKSKKSYNSPNSSSRPDSYTTNIRKTQHSKNQSRRLNDFDIFHNSPRSSTSSHKKPPKTQNSDDSSKTSANSLRKSNKKPEKSHHTSSKETNIQDLNSNILNDEKAVRYMTELVKLRCAVESPERVQELNSKAKEIIGIPPTTQESIVNDLFKDLMASKRVNFGMDCSSVSCYKCGTISEDHLCEHSLREFLEQC